MGKETLKQRYPKWKHGTDFCVLAKTDPLQTEERRLLLAEPGDLILWDSRTVHGGRVGTGQGAAATGELARMAVGVAMTERRRASDEVQRRRREGFDNGETFNHCPHEAGTSSGTVPGRFSHSVTLTEAQRAL